MGRDSRWCLCLGLWLTLALAACPAAESPRVALVFPDEEARGLTRAVHLRVVSAQRLRCDQLLDGSADLGDAVVHVSQRSDFPPKDSLRLAQVPQGQQLFYAEGLLANHGVFLRGCTAAEVRRQDGEDIVVVLRWTCHPDASGQERAGNDVDDDCDGQVDECGQDADCDDADPCTIGRCVDGRCSLTDRLEGSGCDDGDPCTLDDACVGGRCAGTPKSCAALTVGCVVGACDSGSGQCRAVAAADGTTCDDGRFCTEDDRCAAGVCAGAPRSCDDRDACTRDLCIEADRRCLFAPTARPGAEGPGVDGSCDNQRDDDCDGRVDGDDPDCLACRVDADCDDANPCTADRCVDGSCGHDLASGDACDDGIACTAADTCAAGVCAGVLLACAELDGACALGGCSEAQEACVAVPLSEGAACDDGRYCTEGDRCSGGACAGEARDCSDPDPCQVGTCDEEARQCVSTPLATPGTEGPPGDPSCVNEEDDDCDGLVDQADVDSCLQCQRDTDCASEDACLDVRCESGLCVSRPVAGAVDCDDADPCTEGDRCGATGCAGTPRDCSHLDDACNNGVCDRERGACVAQPRGLPACQPPQIAHSCGEVLDEDQPYRCAPAVVDQDPRRTYTWLAAPEHSCAWLRIEPASGEITGTPDDDDVGGCTLAFMVSNGLAASEPIAVEVLVRNVTPTLAIEDAAVAVDAPRTEIRSDGDVEASDEPFGVYSLDEAPAPACAAHGAVEIDPTSGAIYYAPAPAYSGDCAVTVRFDDQNGVDGVVVATFSVQVAGSNTPPRVDLDACPDRVLQDTPYRCSVGAEDPDPEDTLYFIVDASSSCAWVKAGSLDPVSGAIDATPDDEDVGVCTLAIKVIDGRGGQATAQRAIEVQNRAPTLSIAGPVSLDEDAGLTLLRTDAQVQASEEGHGVYRLDTSPRTDPRCVDHGSVQIDPTSGAISYNPTQDYFGSCAIRVVFDDQNTADNLATAALEVLVRPVNDPPTLQVGPGLRVQRDQSAAIGVAVLHAVDVDNTADELRYRVIALPTLGSLLLRNTVLRGSEDAGFTQRDVDEGALVYKAGATSVGDDHFDFALGDGQLELAPARVDIEVFCVCSAQTRVFSATGTFTVPVQVEELTVKAWGGGGGGGEADFTAPSGEGGGGGFAGATLAVAPGQVLEVFVGGGGNHGQCGDQSAGGAGSLYAGGDGAKEDTADGQPGEGSGQGGIGGTAGQRATSGGEGHWGAGGGGGSANRNGGGGGAATSLRLDGVELLHAGGGGGGGGAGNEPGGAGGAGCGLPGVDAAGTTNPEGGGGGGGGGACLGTSTANGTGRQPGNADEASGAGLGGLGARRCDPGSNGAAGKVIVEFCGCN